MHMLETATSTPAYNAPFGSWPKDFDWESIRPPAGSSTYLSLSHSGRVDIFPDHGVVTKIYWDSPASVERIWNLMQLAGNCSVSLVGRIFFEPGSTQVHGYTMPIETPIDTENFGTKHERIRLIYQLRDLLAEMHSKNIVHGDIKPQNVLICSDGHPRFCDFDNASIEGDEFVATSMTYPCCT
ncbi:hypothetical protein B0H15DRAFT_608462 [Mycena belliarum]|uniref:Protein kinase domain-containing protein n=1 Tax=Mycena belliarum TaxID=1033014 RepID=A0AAD6TRC6_9AGAR|nr:hypothetical protein B0H15DRAFT_608462 [Mycena belliae]